MCELTWILTYVLPTGEDHLDVAHTLHVLAEVRHLQGNHEKALETVAQVHVHRSVLSFVL